MKYGYCVVAGPVGKFEIIGAWLKLCARELDILENDMNSAGGGIIVDAAVGGLGRATKNSIDTGVERWIGLKLGGTCPVIGDIVGERINISIACGGIIVFAAVGVNLGETNIGSRVCKIDIIGGIIEYPLIKLVDK